MVQICSAAYVGLVNNNKVPVYLILLGVSGNNQTSISQGSIGTTLATCNTTFVLDCHSPTSLWISWAHGVIQVGTGTTVGHSVICEYNDPTPQDAITNVMLSTQSAAGQWQVENRMYLTMYESLIFVIFLLLTEIFHPCMF